MKRLITITLITYSLAGCKEPEILSPDMIASAHEHIDRAEIAIRVIRRDSTESPEVINRSIALLEDSIKLTEDKCLKPRTRDRQECLEAGALALKTLMNEEKMTRTGMYKPLPGIDY